MKKITALNMNWNEYSEVVDKATEGKATLIITDGEWDYVCENGYELEVKEINENYILVYFFLLFILVILFI